MRFRHIPFLLAGLAAAAIAVATVVSGGGAMFRSPWFVLLWGGVALSGFVVVWRRRLWRRPVVFLLHASLLVVLSGALTTNLTGRCGTLHLRMGIPTDKYCNGKSGTEKLPCLVRLDTFEVLYYSGTHAPCDYVSRLTTSEGRRMIVSVNRIGHLHGYRLCQTSYDEDLRGSLLSVNCDPWGTAITYTGYLLFLLSFLASLWKPALRLKSAVVWRRGGRASLAVKALLTAALLAHFLARWHAVGHLPLSNLSETLLFAALCLAPFLTLGSVVAIMVAVLTGNDSHGASLAPVLNSAWLGVHVGSVVLSYALLVASFFHRELLRYAVSLLAVGIFLGAAWANVSWGAYWSWDPKESWALVTLLVYSIPLHSGILPWFRSQRNYRLYSLLALAALLMTYFGVSYLLGGMHSYG